MPAIAATTHSTAQRNGWVWDIGLQHRRGVGHVFSTDYQTVPETEVVLDQYLKTTGRTEGLDGLSPRLLTFDPGYRESFWVKNCVGVGLSAGFIEPLEASALVLIELSASAIAEQLPQDKATMAVVAKRFNREFSSRWEQIIDFLKLHYVLSQRTDSDYWRDNRSAESIPDTLAENLLLWRSRAPWYYDDNRRDDMFPSASYQYVLYGMGFKSAVTTTQLRNNPVPERGGNTLLCRREKESTAIQSAPAN
jgi:hypothetical protein